MPIITFWSDSNKTIGQSVSAACMATVMAIEHNYKVLLISADVNNYTIENCFGAQESNKQLVQTLLNTSKLNFDSGISGLFKLAESNRVTPESIHDYTKIIFKNRLEILYSPNGIAEDKSNTLMEQFKNIIISAAGFYDQVIVDLKKGLKYSEQMEILEISDVIVSNVEQNKRAIEECLSRNEIKNLINKNKVIWNICRYDKNSKYNVKNLTRGILKRQAVYETDYNTLVLDASQEGNIVELLIRFKTLKNEEQNILFLNKVEKLTEGIISKYKETRIKS